MEYISLHGTDNRLYELVARLVMSPDVLRQNNNYPFKTTAKYVWYLCLNVGQVVGFMPVRPSGSGLYIDNYYISNDDPEILDGLIGYLLSQTDGTVTALCHKRHTDAFRLRGFITCTVFAQYNKMQNVRRKGEPE